jgi:hypothetical protein
MATGETPGPVHPVPTQRSGYRYFFYDKHHGRDRSAAQWRPDVTHEQEFNLFDAADFHESFDDRGWLYGIGRDEEGEVIELGTWGQWLAEFPFARPGELWHGYPMWPVNEAAPPNRRRQNCGPTKDVFNRMEAVGLIDSRECVRLKKGDFL